MSGSDDTSDPKFERRGAPWAEDDHLELVAAIRDGLTDEQLEATLGRTVYALQARAQLMLGGTQSRATALDALREALDSDPNYDWRTPVQAAAAEKGYHYWTRTDEQVLARGWVDATPMPALVAQLRLPESVIARQLIGLRLASSREEIASRIGTMPGGDHALRQALAKDRDAATVWCLVVAIGSRRPNISIHGSSELAEAARDELLDSAAKTKTVHWAIAARYPGGGDHGPLTAGTVEPEPKAGGATPAQRRWARGPGS